MGDTFDKEYKETREELSKVVRKIIPFAGNDFRILPLISAYQGRTGAISLSDLHHDPSSFCIGIFLLNFIIYFAANFKSFEYLFLMKAVAWGFLLCTHMPYNLATKEYDKSLTHHNVEYPTDIEIFQNKQKIEQIWNFTRILRLICRFSRRKRYKVIVNNTFI